MSSVVSMAHFVEKATQLRELRDKLGKSTPLDIAVRLLQSYGVNWIWTRVSAPSKAAHLENVAWFGEEIIASFRAK
jgi:hypothetical protein